MNILHMKYAVEVARLGSLNKAAETLKIKIYIGVAVEVLIFPMFEMIKRRKQ